MNEYMRGGHAFCRQRRCRSQEEVAFRSNNGTETDHPGSEDGGMGADCKGKSNLEDVGEPVACGEKSGPLNEHLKVPLDTRRR